MSLARAVRLRALRAGLESLDQALRPARVLAFGDARVDGCFPAGGLPLGCWHDLTGSGIEEEQAAATAAFAARLCAGVRAQKPGPVVWVFRRDDLYAPGAAELGLEPSRLVLIRTGSEAETLAAIEDALRSPGVAAAVGEVERVDLTAGRRLQLACEQHGATGLLLRRRLYGLAAGQRRGGEPATAASRWRISPAPSQPPAGEPGLGPPRWRVELERARGGRTGAWIVEAQNGAVPFRVVAELADHTAQTGEEPKRRAG
jgi:protein ImuA